ncbi:hypothetical protein Tco_0435705 [Tanacetum coccineum]
MEISGNGRNRSKSNENGGNRSKTVEIGRKRKKAVEIGRKRMKSIEIALGGAGSDRFGGGGVKPSHVKEMLALLSSEKSSHEGYNGKAAKLQTE